ARPAQHTEGPAASAATRATFTIETRSAETCFPIMAAPGLQSRGGRASDGHAQARQASVAPRMGMLALRLQRRAAVGPVLGRNECHRCGIPLAPKTGGQKSRIWTSRQADICNYVWRDRAPHPRAGPIYLKALSLGRLMQKSTGRR